MTSPRGSSEPTPQPLAELASVDDVIDMWLRCSEERWDDHRREQARSHTWPRYLTQFTLDELHGSATQLRSSKQPFTWGSWYRRTRRVAIPRLGPMPPGARIAGAPPVTDSLQRAQAALAAGDNQQALAAAQAAIRQAGAIPSDLTITTAAEIVLAAFLADVHDLTGVEAAVDEAVSHLKELERACPACTKHLAPHLQQVAAATVHLQAGTPAALTRLCALLRKAPFHRSDLGVRAAEAALAQDPQNVAALTTQGAALIDLHKLPKAEDALTAAWQLNDKNAYTAVALCRLHVRGGWTTEALRWGEIAVELDPDSTPARRMYLAARLAAGDLTGVVEDDQIDDDTTPSVSKFDAVEAAKQLAAEGHIEKAREALTRLLDPHPGYPPALQALANLDD